MLKKNNWLLNLLLNTMKIAKVGLLVFQHEYTDNVITT